MNARKLIIRTAGLVNTELSKTHWPLFFTLTYRDGEKWESKQISNFIDNYRVFIKRQLKDKNYKLTYIWTVENNKDRDYIHYHGLIWIPNGILPPKPDTTERTRDKWWKYGDSNVQKAYSPASYIGKYIGKEGEALKLPQRSRKYSINVRHLFDLSYLRAPSWLCYNSKFGDKLRRVKHYGWVNYTTNKCYDSPYRFSKIKGLVWKGWHEPRWASHHNRGRLGIDLTAYDLWLIAIGEKPEYKFSSEFQGACFSMGVI